MEWPTGRGGNGASPADPGITKLFLHLQWGQATRVAHFPWKCLPFWKNLPSLHRMGVEGSNSFLLQGNRRTGGAGVLQERTQDWKMAGHASEAGPPGGDTSDESSFCSSTNQNDRNHTSLQGLWAALTKANKSTPDSDLAQAGMPGMCSPERTGWVFSGIHCPRGEN